MKEWSNKPSALITTSATSASSGSAYLVNGASSAMKLKTASTYVAPIAVFNPIAGGVAMAAIGAVLYGGSNIIQFARKKKAGKTAAIDTVKDTLGLGVAGTLGLASAGAVATLGSTMILPAAVGIGVTFVSKKIWNRLVSRYPKATKAKV